MRGGKPIPFSEFGSTAFKNDELIYLLDSYTKSSNSYIYVTPYHHYEKELADAILIALIKKFPNEISIDSDAKSIYINYDAILDKRGRITIYELEEVKSLTALEINTIINKTVERSHMLEDYDKTLSDAIIRTLIINFPKYVSFIENSLRIDFNGILDNFKSGSRLLQNNSIVIEGYTPPPEYKAYYISTEDKRLTLLKTRSSSRTNLKNVTLNPFRSKVNRSKVNRSNESNESSSFEMKSL